MAKLNRFQTKCVEADGHLLIVACPGSGKTTVLTHRAEYLLDKNSDGNLLGVTFSKDAAGELRGRMVKKVPHAKNRIGSGTFHSLAMRQLKRADVVIDLMDDREVRSIIESILDSLDEPPEIDVITSDFTTIQSSLNQNDHPLVVGNKITKYVWEKYQKIKHNARKVDFGDLLLLAVRGMRDGTIKPYPVKWILGDESQDMDELQHEWIKIHAENGTDVTLVGDDDQSIFAFRAAQGFGGMEKFKMALNAKMEMLPINYRCGKAILAAAAKLISFNSPNRIDKPIEAGVDYDGVIHKTAILSPCDEDGESKSHYEYSHMINKIKEHKFTEEESPYFSNDWAILARGNITLNEIERELLNEGIEYGRKSGSFWDQPVLRSYLSVLKYLTEGKWFGFAIFINNFLGSDLVFDHRVNNLNSLYQLAKDEGLKKKLKTLIYYERVWLDMLMDGSQEKEEELLIDVAAFVEGNLTTQNLKTREKQVNLIRDACLILSKTKGKDLKNKIFLRTSPAMNKGKSIDEKREAARKENKLFISLLTMHSSKGLEFDNVWLSGCESANFTEPKKDGSMSDIKEERRLFYVSMTRAKYHLYTSMVGNEQKPDALFLQEAGILEWNKPGFGD
ncbi:DNA helicase PcrA [Thiomicrorhabdus hydrogeniphila]